MFAKLSRVGRLRYPLITLLGTGLVATYLLELALYSIYTLPYVEEIYSFRKPYRLYKGYKVALVKDLPVSKRCCLACLAML
jgi:hypothetical protein